MLKAYNAKLSWGIQLFGICTGLLIFPIHRLARCNPIYWVADWAKSVGVAAKTLLRTHFTAPQKKTMKARTAEYVFHQEFARDG
jgi:hypothetical protein